MSKTAQDNQIFCTQCFKKQGTHFIENSDGIFCNESCYNAFKILNDGNFLQNRKTQSSTSSVNLEHLVKFKKENISVIEFDIPSIHCISCVHILENASHFEPNIKSVRVDFLNRKAKISYDNQKYSLEQLIVFLKKIGYEPNLNLNLDNPQITNKKNKLDKNLLIKLGIAGFAASNIMLFSLPEYLGLEGDFTLQFKWLFGYLNLALSLPVVFISASDYFKSAANAIRLKEINFDIPTCLGFVSLLGLSYYEILSGTGAGYLDSFSALIFFLLISRYFQNKTFNAIDFDKDFNAYFPLFATKIDDYDEKQVYVKSLKKGDKILIKNNEIIPVLSSIVRGKGILDYSFLTGESTPIEVSQNQEIKSGARWLSKPVIMEVKESFAQNDFLSSWKNTYNQEPSTEKSYTDWNAKIFLYAMLIISISVATYWVLQSSLTYGVYIFTCLLVTACPCVLALASPVVNGIISRTFARNGFFVKDASSIYNFSKINTIVFDKTGTLSESKNAKVTYMGTPLDMNEKVALKSLLKASTHPYSGILYQHIQSEYIDIEDFEEIVGQGIKGNVSNKTLKIGKYEFVSMLSDDANNQNYDAAQVWISIDNVVKGYFKIETLLREKIGELMIDINHLKLEKHVLSGDNTRDAHLLLKILGLDAKINFHQTPENKSEYIKQLKSNNKNVLMVGDGLNDALALQNSNFSISVTEIGSRFFPACQGVLQSESFSKLGKFIRLAKMSKRMVNICFSLSIFYNIIGISLAANGLLTPLVAAILMPLNSLTVLITALLISNFYSNKILN